MIVTIPAMAQVDEDKGPVLRKRMRRRHHRGIRGKWAILKGLPGRFWRTGYAIPVAFLVVVLLIVGWLIGSHLNY